MNVQPAEAQRGEIEFRKKLVEQQIEGKVHFDNEFDSAAIEKILRDRMDNTRSRMQELRASGMALEPFIEIGAERCQRSIVMTNDVGVPGAACDLSFDMLKSGAHYARVFGKEKTPLRVCCDAHTLPFLDGSIPFVFCYETLHHFPDPAPIVAEAHRVLCPGGSFVFEEEPCRAAVRLKLYQGLKMYSKEARARGRVRRFFDDLFARPSCNEIEHGIIENDELALGDWLRATEVFAERSLRVRASRSLSADMVKPSSLPVALACRLLGGEVSSVCKKDGSLPATPTKLEEALACPVCLGKKAQNRVHLSAGGSAYECSGCRTTFPVRDGVLFLFKPEKLAELYPDVSTA